MNTIKLAAVAALLLASAGCSDGERTETHKGWRSFVAAGGYTTHIVPVTLDDGTRCVVAFGNSAGRAVSCGWPDAK